ncbi:hypothetical protein DPMN_129173 [Dreissena polymorpha]|uniref:Uncharacterized protein n=1 Tax=Dreissena polymorpha TaxID=45954 RepID=A0A9D4H261_DREPO|nr:hypothetical protein DPMN_129173 [Dreissena polymorpha]
MSPPLFPHPHLDNPSLLILSPKGMSSHSFLTLTQIIITSSPSHTQVCPYHCFLTLTQIILAQIILTSSPSHTQVCHRPLLSPSHRSSLPPHPLTQVCPPTLFPHPHFYNPSLLNLSHTGMSPPLFSHHHTDHHYLLTLSHTSMPPPLFHQPHTDHPYLPTLFH